MFESSSIVAYLQNLYFSENKPTELRPLDLVLLTYLLLQQNEDVSQGTLAAHLGCEHKAIGRSIRRLCAVGWVVSKERGIGRACGLSVNLETLPQKKERTKHSQPSPLAVEYSQWYTGLLIKNGLGPKIRSKTFDRQQEYAAQRLIDELGVDKFANVVAFALDDPRHRKAACNSLYRVRTKLSVIECDYDAAQLSINLSQKGL